MIFFVWIVIFCSPYSSRQLIFRGTFMVQLDWFWKLALLFARVIFQKTIVYFHLKKSTYFKFPISLIIAYSSGIILMFNHIYPVGSAKVIPNATKEGVCRWRWYLGLFGAILYTSMWYKILYARVSLDGNLIWLLRGTMQCTIIFFFWDAANTKICVCSTGKRFTTTLDTSSTYSIFAIQPFFFLFCLYHL